MRYSCFSLVLLAAPLAAQQAAPRAFTPNDWYRVTTLSAPAVSPDGKQVAFTVTTVVTTDNKRHSEVWMVPAAGGAPMRLTSPSVESSQPRWSPDGKLLLFTSMRPGAKGRTFALRMDRPGGEAFEYDSLPAGASLAADRRTMAWSEAAPPDTTKKGDDPYAKMKDPTSRPPFGAITKPLDPARFDGRHFVEFPIKGNGQGYLANAREARAYRPRQVWVQTIAPGDEATGRPYAITRRKVTDAAYSHNNVAISPDGQWIAFTADARLRSDSVVQAERDSLAKLPYDRKRDEMERNDIDLYVLPAAGGAPRKVAELPGTEGDVAWSPDGKSLSFIYRATRTSTRA